MPLVLDTGIIYAYYDRRDSWHTRTAALLKAEKAQLVVPTPVIPEVDYLLGERLGHGAQLVFYRGLTSASFFRADLSPAGYERVLEINQRYDKLRLGLVDAAVIAIAEAMGIGRIATTDRRHFGAVEARIPLTLLP